MLIQNFTLGSQIPEPYEPYIGVRPLNRWRSEYNTTLFFCFDVILVFCQWSHRKFYTICEVETSSKNYKRL